MAEAAAQRAASASDTTTSSDFAPVGNYTLVGSYSTVQVLSPTQVNDVVYATISTLPSGVIASMPVGQQTFDQGDSASVLGVFAQNIEEIMADPRVIAATGAQNLDTSGLLQDAVVFTVQYVDPVRAPNGATAEASVPVSLLHTTQGGFGAPAVVPALAIIDGVYANLKAAAGG